MHRSKAINLITLTVALISSTAYGADDFGFKMLLLASKVIERDQIKNNQNSSSHLKIKRNKKGTKSSPYQCAWQSIIKSPNFETARDKVVRDEFFIDIVKFYKENTSVNNFNKVVKELEKETIREYAFRIYKTQKRKDFVATIEQAVKQCELKGAQSRNNLLRAVVFSDKSIPIKDGQLSLLTGLSQVLAYTNLKDRKIFQRRKKSKTF